MLSCKLLIDVFFGCEFVNYSEVLVVYYVMWLFYFIGDMLVFIVSIIL